MAIADNGSFLKGLRGSAVNLTFKGFHSETVVQGKRKKGQSNPSPQFIASQVALARAVEIFQKAGSVISDGFTTGNPNSSGYNKYSKEFFKHVDYSSAPAITIFYDEVLTSKGNMTITNLSDTPDPDVSDGTITLVWPTAVVDETQNANDISLIVVYNQTQDKWFGVRGPLRSTGGGAISVPDNFMEATNVLRVYIGFLADETEENAGRSSDSVNTSAIVVA